MYLHLTYSYYCTVCTAVYRFWTSNHLLKYLSLQTFKTFRNTRMKARRRLLVCMVLYNNLSFSAAFIRAWEEVTGEQREKFFFGRDNSL